MTDSVSSVPLHSTRLRKKPSDPLHRLLQVGNDVVHILDTYRKTDQVGSHTGLNQLLVGQLAMRVTCRLTSSSCHPKIFIKEFCNFLMPCHQHCLCINFLVLCINFLVQRQLNLYCCNCLCQCKYLIYAHINL